MFQSTPLREGRRKTCYEVGISDQVSIHAPTRGATAALFAIVALQLVSIHAPTRGATESHRGRCMGHGGFNPRPYARGDWKAIVDAAWGTEVSIHAPTRGATRIVLLLEQLIILVSIHAPTRGATSALSYIAAKLSCFNPRPYARGDCPRQVGRCSLLQFQSTPLREGRRLGHGICSTGVYEFQSTPLREGRRQIFGGSVSILRFQSTPLREGRRRGWAASRSRHGCFNPRPYARGDPRIVL